MKVGVPTEIKTDEYRVALTPAGRARARRARPRGGRPGGRRRGLGDRRRRLHGAGRAHPARRRGGLRRGRHDRQGQGAPGRPRWRCSSRATRSSPTCTSRPTPSSRAGWWSRARPASPTRRSRTTRGRLPLLAPMSEVAGKIATQAGAFMLEKPLGGRGLLLGGVPGVAAGKVMVIGGGVVGMNAAIIAIGMGAETYVFDRNIDRLRELESTLNGRASTCYASTLAIEERLPRRRPRDRRRARPRRQGAARRHARAARADEAQRGARRRLDRPGRLLRDLAADDPLRPHLRGRRHHPLLRGQHARRGADHLDLRADERDDALRPRPRRRRRRRPPRRRTPGSSRASTWRPARSPTRRWPRPPATSTRRSFDVLEERAAA